METPTWYWDGMSASVMSVSVWRDADQDEVRIDDWERSGGVEGLDVMITALGV